MFAEVVVTLKGEDTTFKKKFPTYDPISFSGECPFIKEMIAQTKAEFKGTVEEVIIKATKKEE